MNILKNFQNDLKVFYNLERAKWDEAYHKSRREHWGVTAPKCDVVIKHYLRQHSAQKLIELCKELWKSNVFDLMIAAARIVSDKKIPASEMLWKCIKKWMQDVDGWALEDNLARAAWKCIEIEERILDDLEDWTNHKNFWYRRAALIFTLPYARPGKNPERMLKWAGQYASEKEWFIQKAIGWWLRDLGQHNPQRVMNFLKVHWHQLQYVARRESTRKLDPKYLNELS